MAEADTTATKPPPHHEANRGADHAPEDQATKIQRMKAFLAQVHHATSTPDDSLPSERVAKDAPAPEKASPSKRVAKDTPAPEKETHRLLVLNGPNLNLLGIREADIYGHTTLADIETRCRERIHGMRGVTLDFFQSNHEGVLIDRIQEARGGIDLIIFNPAAYTHTSIAIRDALLAVQIPVIEVHLSNIHQRESFRHHSHISDIALGHIVGLGPDGYELAVEAGVRYLSALAHQAHGNSPHQTHRPSPMTAGVPPS